MAVTDLLEEVEVLTAAGDPDQAIDLYLAWLKNTDSPLKYAVYFNLGVVLSNSKDAAGAEQAYRESLYLKPDFIEAHLNLGTLLEGRGRTDEALAQWREILHLDGVVLSANKALHVQALNNLGRLLEITRQFQDAERMLAESLTLDPDQPHALQHWIHLRQKQCKWPIYGDLAGVGKQQMQLATSALSALGLFDDPGVLLSTSRRFVAERINTRLPRISEEDGYAHGKLRIGYLSSDFCLHPVAMLTVELYELHDRSKVEVYGFCWSREDGSSLRRRVIDALDHHVCIADMTDEEAAQCIRSHEIDILVDLHGLTSGVRPNILSYKPAPVQVTYLGYPGTTAMPSIDYVIADKFVLPESLTTFFTERPLYLPHTFQVSDSKRRVGPMPTRASCGLPENAFVFCCFNNNYKITEEIFAAWMRILQRVPDSVLWLLADNQWAQENLGAAALQHGIGTERLVFGGRIAPSDYLARYLLADLFLDTTPFNAGTTANDSLWAGLPVLTCAGRTFASRMAGSLLNAIGLPELITTTLKDYEEEAVRLGQNRDGVAALKRRLNDNRSKLPLFDIPQLVGDLECAYERVAVRRSGIGKQSAIPTETQEKGRHAVNSLSPQQIVTALAVAQAKVEIGMLADARAIYEQVLQQIPNQRAAVEMLSILDQREHVQAAKERFPGPEYLEWLNWLHQTLKPASYLEIGVETGQSLRFARGPTRAVGIDPQIHIVHSQECWVKLFKLTSDDFFAQHDLYEVMDKQLIDLAFIDGLHTFEQALKDFINIERYAHAGTVVALHDIFPVTPVTAARNRQSLFWLGDTWKAVLILRKTRPDLKIFTLPAFPSGLTLVTGLDRTSRRLSQDFDALVDDWMDAELDSHMADLDSQLNVVNNDFELVARLLAR